MVNKGGDRFGTAKRAIATAGFVRTGGGVGEEVKGEQSVGDWELIAIADLE